jgi:hypothetical protein
MIRKGQLGQNKWCVAFQAVRSTRSIIVSSVGSHSASEKLCDRAYDYTQDIDSESVAELNADGRVVVSPFPVQRPDGLTGSSETTSSAKPIIIDLDGDGVELSLFNNDCQTSFRPACSSALVSVAQSRSRMWNSNGQRDRGIPQKTQRLRICRESPLAGDGPHAR